jgi:hypothetical protein
MPRRIGSAGDLVAGVLAFVGRGVGPAAGLSPGSEFEKRAMTAADFRRIALSLPDATEGSHFGNPDFRVGGRIFATLSLERDGYGVLLLTPEQQAGMVQDEPAVFSPVPGGWGRNGSTRVLLSKAAPEVLEGALQTAWQSRVANNAGPKKAGKTVKARKAR